MGQLDPLIGLLLLCAFLSFATDSFFTARNLLNVLDQITVLGIMAVGMTFVILIGGIDLSVGSILALSMMVMGYLSNEVGMALPLAIVIALFASAVAGAITGLLITEFSVPAFISTLAMMSVARGLANMITDGQQIVGFPGWFNLLAIIRHGGFLTVTVGLMLVVFVAGWIFLRNTTGGRCLLCNWWQSGSGASGRYQCAAVNHPCLYHLSRTFRPRRHCAGRKARLGAAKFRHVL